MIPEKDYVFNPEKHPQKHGVVIFLVNELGCILYGEQLVNNGRGSRGDLSLIGESRDTSGSREFLLMKALKEEIGSDNVRSVLMPDNLRTAWLGSVTFLTGVNAQVYCLKWIGGSQVPVRINSNGSISDDDFMALGWISLEDLQNIEVGGKSMRRGMQNVIWAVLSNERAVERVLAISKL